MASYFQNSPNLFDKRFAELRKKDPNAQTLYMYQEQCRHRNSEGLFWLPRPYIIADLGMDAHEVDRALEVLEKAGFLNYDFENDIILDRLGLKWFRPTGDKQIKGAVRVFTQVPQSPLKVEFVKLARMYAGDFADFILEANGELAGPALGDYPIEGVSGNSNTASPDKTAKGYPEPEIPRDELSAKHLRDELSGEVAPEDKTGYDPVAHLKSDLGAEVISRGDSR